MMRVWFFILTFALGFFVGSIAWAAEFTVEFPDITFTPARANGTVTTTGLTIINIGSEPLEFSGDGISISNSAGGVFSVFGTPDLSPLEVGAERTFVLAFAPVDLGFVYGQVLLETNGENPAEFYPLRGIGYQISLIDPVLSIDLGGFGTFSPNYFSWLLYPLFPPKIAASNSLFYNTSPPNLIALWATLENPTGAPDEEIAFTGSLPSGIVVSPYDASNRRLLFFGSSSLSNYQTVLRNFEYRDSSDPVNPAERIFRVLAIDDNFILSRPSYSGIDGVAPPPNAPIDALLDDDFESPSFDTGLWQVLSGATPTHSNSNLVMTNSVIRSIAEFRGVPLWFHVKGSGWLNMPSSSPGAVFEVVSGNKTLYLGLGGETLTGNATSYFGWINGNTLLETASGPIIANDDFDVSFYLSTEMSYLFLNEIPLLEFPALNGVTTPAFLKLTAANNAVLNIDRVVIGEEATGNPAWHLAPQGNQPSVTMGATGVDAAINLSGISTPSFLKVTRIDRRPDGIVDADPLPLYWLTEGLSGRSFSATLKFHFDPVAVSAAGIDPDSLSLYVSTNRERSWALTSAVYDSVNSCFTLAGVTNAFRAYALMGDPIGLDPAIEVLLESTPLVPGGAPVNFGTAAFDGTAPARTFEVRNNGTGALQITGVQPPDGFTITEGLSATIAAGGSDMMTIALDTSAGGLRGGNVTIESNDPTFPQFVIPLTGRVEMTEAWVDFNYSGAVAGTQSQPFVTMSDALNAVVTGGTIKFKPGAKFETHRIDRAMRLEAVGGAARIGSGP